jgi:hypothetical protein
VREKTNSCDCAYDGHNDTSNGANNGFDSASDSREDGSLDNLSIIDCSETVMNGDRLAIVIVQVEVWVLDCPRIRIIYPVQVVGVNIGVNGRQWISR